MTTADTDPSATIKACLADPTQDWRLCGYDIEWLVAEVERLRGIPPTGGHTMKVKLEYDRITLAPVCHEPEGAVCRVTCAAKDPCESYGYPEHECGLKSLPYCNAVEWLTGDDWAERHCNVKKAFPLFDGMPIEVKWEGDGYSWSPVKNREMTT